ncbi:unnamed protein product [Cylicocyclus nassatus]|uniref:Uncharacterized protein n=1 Tax=Cylicocyclus nassatus TaxID=53992 RepID=A0AA36GML5_CYLNA|nr:unnamed protein product [Cylicocyclus nassatus]
MEVDERPLEQYSDIGGCDKQIQELIEAVVPPMTHKDRFVKLGTHPPKGVLLYGPPGAKRFDSEKAGDRGVQRTMHELLNQLDGFQPNDEIKMRLSAGVLKPCQSLFRELLRLLSLLYYCYY